MTTPPPGAVGAHHPSTARDAADGSAYTNLDHRGRILVRLLANGEHGITAAEVAAEIGCSTNIAGSRLQELRGDGCAADKFPKLVVRTQRKRSLNGGRPGFVHCLNADGERAAKFIARQLGVDC